MKQTTIESIAPLLAATRKASQQFGLLPNEKRQAVLHSLAELIEKYEVEIIIENEKDLVRMDDANPKKDRLRLTPARIQDLIDSTLEVASLTDPVGQQLRSFETTDGLRIEKIAVPLGVVGMIYESRPNVTLDVAALCLRSGNAAILRGGSDADASNRYLVSLIHQALEMHDIPKEVVCLLPTDRKYVAELLTATEYVDILIPRGSQSLIDFVRDNATVPTIETGAGVCHTYVTSTADLEKAAAIVVNAKVSRPSVCNSLDTILVDAEVADAFFPLIQQGMAEYEVEIFADDRSYAALSGYPHLQQAGEDSFGQEYLSYKCSAKVVDSYLEALDHIARFSSKHSEAIISEDAALCEQFLKEVDAAAVFANASTRFTDGGVFGLGAEIGISTQKLHARGPFALEKLVTEKWVVRGEGQVR